MKTASRRHSQWILLCCIAVGGGSSCEPPPYVQLEIGIDPSVTEPVTSIGISVVGEEGYRLSRQLTEADVNRLIGGELTLTVTSNGIAQQELIVEGLSRDDAFSIVARARILVTFGGEQTQNVILRTPCDGDDHPSRSTNPDSRCPTEVFSCNGRRQICSSEVCQCPEPFCGDGVTDVATEVCDDGNLNPNDGCDRCEETRWHANVLIGLGASAADPSELALDSPVDVATSADGTIYVVDQGGARVWRVADGRVSVFAGTGRGDYSPLDEGRPAALAALASPAAIAVDGIGRVFIAEGFSGGSPPRVRVIDERGNISTYGNTDQFLQCPLALAADPDGTLYIADCNDFVWVIDAATQIEVPFAGSGAFEVPEHIGDGGLAVNAFLMGVAGIASDGRGRVYITEEFGNRIRVVENDRIATIVGEQDGTAGFSGDDGPARLAAIDGPIGVLFGGDGTLYFADAYNYRVRAIGLDGIIRTVVGNGIPADGLDGALGIETSLVFPVGIARAGDGSLLIADPPSRKVRLLSAGSPIVTTALGRGRAEVSGDGGPATSATFRKPGALALSPNALLVADPAAHRVRSVSFDGDVVQAYAGSGELDGRGESGLAGDGAAAAAARLNRPAAVAFDATDNAVFIADEGNRRLRRVDESGKIESVVGGGTLAPTFGETDAKTLNVSPAGVVVDPDGRVFFSDTASASIVRLAASGTTAARIAGSLEGDAAEVDGVALSVGLRQPRGITWHDNKLVFVDQASHLARQIDLATGNLTTIAGGAPLLVGAHGNGYTPYLDFAGPATRASLGAPARVTSDSAGNIYISDRVNHRVRRIDGATGNTTVLVGWGENFDGAGAAGFGGDFGPGTLALLDGPEGMVVIGTTLYIADRFNHRIRALDLSTDVVTTFAGNPINDTSFGFIGAYSGDEGDAASAEFFEPSDVARLGNSLLIADSSNGRIRSVNLTSRIVTTFAGGGIVDAAASPKATEAFFSCPTGLAVAPNNDIYVAEGCVHRVWRIESESLTVNLVAGTGTPGNAGDGGAAIAAGLRFPTSVAIGAEGTLYIADEGNDRIRSVDSAGIIRSYTAPIQSPGFGGDGRSPLEARVGFPSGVDVASDGSLLIADTGNQRIRQVSNPTSPDAIVETIAGGAAPGDGGPAMAALLHLPAAIVSDGADGFFIADEGHFVVRHIDGGGIITTVAGTGSQSFGDVQEEGLLGVETSLGGPAGLALRGRVLYIADATTERVRALNLETGVLVTAAGFVDPGSGDFDSARLDLPAAMVDVDRGFLVAQGDGRVRYIDEIDRVVTTAIGIDGALEGPPPVAAAEARLFRDASGIAFNASASELYVSEKDGHGIRIVTIGDFTDPSTWAIQDLAGRADAPGHLDGNLDRARFRNPSGLAYDATTNALFVADTGNHVIRRIDLTPRTVTTVVGVPGEVGNAADGARASVAHLFSPEGIAVAADGTLFVADTGNNLVRRVRNDTVRRVLGDGSESSSGEGRPARDFPVDAPRGLDLDAYGNLFVTSRTSIRVVVTDNGLISGDDKVLTVYGAAPREDFPEDITRCLSAVVMSGAAPQDLSIATSDEELAQLTAGEDRLVLVDACQGMLIEVSRSRIDASVATE